MSALLAFARAQAVAAGIAQPVSTVRHVHISDRPLVLIALTLAGEANAPLAAMVGDGPDSGRLLIVSQPRNRDQRFAFAAELAEIVVGYIDRYREPAGAVRPAGAGQRERYADAPQIIVPNPASDRLRPAARPVDQVPPASGGVRRRPGRAGARPVADLPRRARRGARLLPAAGRDAGAGAALGQRPERGRRSEPRGPDGLDRPARRA